MNPVADLLAAAAGDSPFPDGPSVTIRWRPPCATERQELFSGPVTAEGGAGVEAAHVVKAVCRVLQCGPGGLQFEPDEKARHLRFEHARCYLLDAAGNRIAHIVGISFAWLNVDASRLANAGWTPGRNREPGLAAAPAAALQH